MENFYEAKPNTTKAYQNVTKLTLPEGMDNFLKYFEEVYES